MVHMHLTLMLMMKKHRNHVGDSECEDDQAYHGDKEGVAKSAFVARSLEYSHDKAYIDTIEGDSDKEF
jgi:hypothetical protein